MFNLFFRIVKVLFAFFGAALLLYIMVWLPYPPIIANGILMFPASLFGGFIICTWIAFWISSAIKG